jgi:hypothetical protein
VVHPALVLGELEVRVGIPRRVVRAEAKVLVRLVGDDQLSGVHLPLRIPESLELAEGVHQLRPEHLLQQRRAGLSIAMLAGERAAVRGHEIGRLVDERPELRDAFLRRQVEIGARVDAAVAEVAVEIAPVAVTL